MTTVAMSTGPMILFAIILMVLILLMNMRQIGMNTVLDELKARVADIDERDDKIVALVAALRGSVQELTALLSSRPQDADLQALADTLSGTVSKFDDVLSGSNPEEPVPPPASEAAPV